MKIPKPYGSEKPYENLSKRMKAKSRSQASQLRVKHAAEKGHVEKVEQKLRHKTAKANKAKKK